MVQGEATAARVRPVRCPPERPQVRVTVTVTERRMLSMLRGELRSRVLWNPVLISGLGEGFGVDPFSGFVQGGGGNMSERLEAIGGRIGGIGAGCLVPTQGVY